MLKIEQVSSYCQLHDFKSTVADLLGKTVRANSHCNRKHSGHGDGYATNEQHQEIVDARSVFTVLDGEHHDNFNHYSNCNANYTEISNSGQHL